MIDTQTTDQSETGNGQPPDVLVSQIEALGQRMAAVREHIGHDDIRTGRRCRADALSHYWLADALLVGYPGLGKTRLVDTLGTVLGLEDPGASSSRQT